MLGLGVEVRSRDELAIRYWLPEGSSLRWELLDVLGRVVAQYSTGWQGAGEHVFRWTFTEPLPIGWYVLRLSAKAAQRSVAVLILP
jgi:hypothetical protein